MKCRRELILTLALLTAITCNPVTDSLVVSTTQAPGKVSEESQNDVSVNPQISSMEIRTNITNRFATTLVTSRVRNLKKIAAETTFSVILPENAFISEFTMEVDGKVYKAYVKEKEEAKQIYQEAVSRGQSAAHVEVSARDSKNFQVSVNIEPESKTIFRLTYEELLQRQNGQYELVLNIHPGQVVDNLSVEVHVNETRPLTFVRTPSLRSGNEISKNEDSLKPSTEIQIINSTSATVTFHPDKNEQSKFADLLGTSKEGGLAGQFVVQYDVERDPQGGEVLIRDGYFVHFFAPSDLEPLPKHVVFVLDHSGSMMGRKFEQLTEAMRNILSDLRATDLFSIVRFTETASVWDPNSNKFNRVNLKDSLTYGQLEPHLKEMNLSEAVEASSEHITRAKQVIENNEDMGLTNIIAGLEVGLFLIKRTQEKSPNKYQPMMVFLTDGLPNVGMHSRDQITETVTKLNGGENRTSIFSLSFGAGADKTFLRKLSSKNLGFSKHIYQAADASLQLQDFYRKISSPLLSNVTFKYVDGVTEVTRYRYPFLFNGSELVVAGRINNDDIPFKIHGICTTGLILYTPIKQEPISSLERLWAYLTVQQLLQNREDSTESNNFTKKALDLALKYSFVTDVTSLVVVKPNQTEPAEGQIKGADAVAGRMDSYLMTSKGSLSISGSRPGTRTHYRTLAAPRFSDSSMYQGPIQTSFRGPSLRRFSTNAFPSAPNSRRFHSARGPPYPPMLVTTTATPISTTTSTHPTTFTAASLNTTLPQWLEDLRSNNQNITTPQGSFQLTRDGAGGAVGPSPSCPKTPLNSTGECRIIFDCPQVFPVLTDINVYLQYFCPLNEYAGVCCPSSTATE